MPLSVDAGDIEGPGEGTVAALPADVLALLGLLLFALLVLCPDGEDAILQLQGDLLLLKAGQLCLQQELVALIRMSVRKAGSLALESLKNFFWKLSNISNILSS